MLRITSFRGLAGLTTSLILAACTADSTGVGGGGGGDTAPPTVQSVVPANGASGVSPGTVVTVVFSEPVQPASVTPATFSVGSATGTITVAGATATFTPSAALPGGAAHTVTVTGVRDIAGNAMTAAFSSSFSVELAPVAANAGPDLHTSFGFTVSLDASASTGSGLSFTWTQIAGPVAATSGTSGPRPTFTAPATADALEFEVAVTDGQMTDRDTVVVFVWEDCNHTYFVAPSGSDANAGTRQSPFATIHAAIVAADNAGNGGDVYVAGGDYTGSVTLRGRVSVYGGFTAATWRRNIATQSTTIAGGPTAMSGTDANNLTLEGLNVRAASATGAGNSSVALLLANSSGVTLRRNLFVAGNGVAGTPGTTGTAGNAGSNGAGGANASSLCIPGGVGGNGGSNYIAGGKGGNGGLFGGFAGVDGSGASGGNSGGGGSTFNNGGDGSNVTTAGAAGTNGSGGAAFGTLSSSGYVGAAGTNGLTDGGHGSGGGGGGGAGGTAASCGPGGGGGGGGGQRGAGGTAGMGGGASIGILLLGSTAAQISDNQITTGTGGAGGAGRNGGAGGAGGGGGGGGARACEAPLNTPCTGSGGDGGDGGTGGRGGHGGGGGGGPSIGIVEAVTASSVLTSNVFTIGTGGAGGTSSGTAGAAGETGQHKKLT